MKRFNVLFLLDDPMAAKWILASFCFLSLFIPYSALAQETKTGNSKSEIKNPLTELQELFGGGTQKDGETSESKPVKSESDGNKSKPKSAPSPIVNLGTLPPVITRAEAFAGRPYGIGKISFRLRPGDEMIDRSGAEMLTDKGGRVRYPVSSKPAVAKFFQNLSGSGGSSPSSVHTVWFLFAGDEPLDLTIQGSLSTSQTIPVEFVKAGKFNRIVNQWWKEYSRTADEQTAAGDYPPLFETYLTYMLPNRLNLPKPKRRIVARTKKKDPLAETLAKVFDVESQRNLAIETALMGLADVGVANLPLPPEPQWVPTDFKGFDGSDIELEPIATCVPEECFYLRFGTWQNQLWTKRLLSEYGGNLGQMISLRGWEPKIESKFLDQLAIESTDFDEMFGGNLISDVAVIGNDMYMQDGASVGVVLQARNTEALKNRLAPRRVAFAKAHQQDGAEIDVFEIDGTAVQFLKTPDNRYRSFYVIAGNSHFITSSLTLATRFLEAAKGIGSMANSPGFRYARREMPLTRDDTIFVYLPTQFFQNLLGPEYQIELRRRNRSVADMQLIELAYLTARSEGLQVDDPATLIANRFLPAGFGKRADGSQLAREGEFWIDSIRGRRGFFTPITDLEITKVTAAEIADFEVQRQFYAEKLPGIDPMFFALKRFKRDDNVERVVFDGRVAPFGKQKYSWLMSMIGPPLEQQVVPSSADILRFSASVKGGIFSDGNKAHQVFGALQDPVNPSVDLKPASLFSMLRLVKSAPWFVGAIPPAGFLDFLPRLGGQPDDGGYTFSSLLGIWRLQSNLFTAISMNRERLEELKNNFRIADLERPAHARLEVGDLAKSNLKNWANVQLYERSWQTSLANTQLLNMLVQQFKLSPAAARETAESLLDVDLVCTLGGEYQLLETPSGRLIWQSTSWPFFGDPVIPDDYLAPVFKWFRGLELEIVNGDSQFAVHGFLDIKRDKAGASLPSFNLFKGFGSVLPGRKPKEGSSKSKSGLRKKPENQ